MKLLERKFRRRPGKKIIIVVDREDLKSLVVEKWRKVVKIKTENEIQWQKLLKSRYAIREERDKFKKKKKQVDIFLLSSRYLNFIRS